MPVLPSQASVATNASRAAGIRALYAAVDPHSDTGYGQLLAAATRLAHQVALAPQLSTTDDPDVLVSLSTAARLLVEGAAHPTCGFVVRPETERCEATAVADTADESLRRLCPELAISARLLTGRLDVDLEIARAVAVRALDGPAELLELTADTAAAFLRVLEGATDYYGALVRDGNSADLVTACAEAASEPHLSQRHSSARLVSVRVAAEVARRSFDRLPMDVRRADALADIELGVRFRALPELSRRGAVDTSVSHLRRAFTEAAFAGGLGLPPAQAARRDGAVNPDRRRPGAR